MAHIPEKLRQLVRQRALGLCEYGQASDEVLFRFDVDHIVPTVAGGTTGADNLCYACAACNAQKRDYLVGTDPLNGNETELYNPRIYTWADHFRWSDDRSEMVGLTAIGRATIDRLRLNRERVVSVRRRWVSVGWHPPQLDNEKDE